MVGRKCGVTPTVVIDAIMRFKDNVVSIDEKGDMSEYTSQLLISHCNYSNPITLHNVY